MLQQGGQKQTKQNGTNQSKTCSGYDSLESIDLLDGLVDIFMPDFKFWTPESAEKYSRWGSGGPCPLGFPDCFGCA
jgi:hypothetical protein